MDEWQLYREMEAYGASPLDVYRQAVSDGLDKANATDLINQLFALDEDQIRWIIIQIYGQKYVQMVEAGASVDDVLAEANKNQVSRVMTVNLLRFLFNFSEREVGSVLGIAGGRIHQLWNRPL